MKSFRYLDSEPFRSENKFYHLYEYSDDICALEDSPVYPGLMNYVKTGLLTEDEVKKAVEYDKNSEM